MSGRFLGFFGPSTYFCRQKKRMKKFLFIVFLAFLALMIFMSEYEPADEPIPQKLEKAIKQARLLEHQDDDYDYVVRYPQFFQLADDSLMDKGACRFTFAQDCLEVVLSAFVEPDAGSLSIQQASNKYAADLHATHQRLGPDYFILSGALRSDTGRIAGRRFHAKFVRHRKFWFVQSLTYPEDCEQALQRLLREIDTWQVWKN